LLEIVMNTARLLAVGLGTLLASLVSGTVGAVAWTRQELRDARTMPVWAAEVEREDREGPSCAPRSVLTVTREDGVALEEQQKTLEVGRTRKTAYAAFSGHWAETRGIFFVIGERTLQAGLHFHTDYGDYLGTLDLAEGASRVHLHADALCFDLAVRRRDGSNALARGQGRLALE
jgi:hypothetical protein